VPSTSGLSWSLSAGPSMARSRRTSAAPTPRHGDGAGCLHAHGLVGVGEWFEERSEQVGVGDAGAVDKRVRAGGAQGAGGVGFAAHDGFKLMMKHAAQISVPLTVFQLDQGLGERLFRPTFWVGLDCVDEKAVEGGEDVREQGGKLRIGDQLAALAARKLLRWERALRR